MSREEFASIGIRLGARYDNSPIVVSDGTKPPADDPHVYRPSACPGGRAPHLFLRDRSSLFDHFGTGFCLLHLHGDHDTRTMEDAARARRIPLRTLKVDLPEGRALYESDLVLSARISTLPGVAARFRPTAARCSRASQAGDRTAH